jgi:hypothetical protein
VKTNLVLYRSRRVGAGLGSAITRDDLMPRRRVAKRSKFEAIFRLSTLDKQRNAWLRLNPEIGRRNQKEIDKCHAKITPINNWLSARECVPDLSGGAAIYILAIQNG